MKIIYMTIILLIELFFNISFAQVKETKLVPIDGQLNDGFGATVASDGNYLVVGAPSYNMHMGYAILYEKIGGVWKEKIKLQASDSTEIQEFGCSVSISGDYIIIGAYYDDQNGINAGAAYIFKRGSNTDDWKELQKLLPDEGSDYDKFGWSVSINGDYAIIGAPTDHLGEVETGSVYIFKLKDKNWVKEEKLFPNNGVGNSQAFGCSVSIYGDYAIIGAQNDRELGTYPGAAYIFYYNGTTWKQQAKLNALDKYMNHGFGYSVSIYEDYAAIGSPSALTKSSGAAFIFHRSDTTWTEEAMVEDSLSSSSINFGESISLEGDYLVAGAPDEDTKGIHSGCSYIFKRNGSSWIEQARLWARDGTDRDKMGSSVFIEGDQVLVGAPVQDADEKYCGAVYIYTGFLTDVNEKKYSFLEDFHLEQNYPNPFNPTTKIKYSIPNVEDANLVSSINVQLKVYDILGREIAILVNEEKKPGNYEIVFNASDLVSGVYFYQLKVAYDGGRSGKFIQTNKMIYLK
jgi:hypothetical protein